MTTSTSLTFTSTFFPEIDDSSSDVVALFAAWQPIPCHCPFILRKTLIRIVPMLHERRMLFRSAGLWTGQAVHWWSYSSSIGELVLHFLFQLSPALFPTHPSSEHVKETVFSSPAYKVWFSHRFLSIGLFSDWTGLSTCIQCEKSLPHHPTSSVCWCVCVCETKSHLLYSSS